MKRIPKGLHRLVGSRRKPVHGARQIKAANPNEKLSVSIRLRRRPDAPKLPDQKYWGKTPADQRVFLTRQQFETRFGAAEGDLKAVKKFLRGAGLQILETSVARRTIVASGTVKKMEKAFGVTLAYFEAPSQTYRGRVGHVHIPKSLAGIIEGVFGLDNRRMARRATTETSFPPMTPPQIATLYNWPYWLKSAAGQTIGLIEFSGGDTETCGYLPSDIDAYFTTDAGIGPGFVSPKITDVSVDGATNSPGSKSDIEVTLDIQVAGAVAQGANIAVYFAPFTEQGWVDAITTAVHDSANAPSVLSISWGWTELEPFGGGVFAWTDDAMTAVSATFQEAAALGVTVFVASGDNGSNCQIGDGRAHVYYPASDPWVTCCGGTEIVESQSAESDPGFSEITWNTTRLVGQLLSTGGTTGGGISDYFDPPYWQAGKGVPTSLNPDKRKGRGIPDIAGYANGYSIVVGGETLGPIGGTSETAPLYAALIALVNAYLSRPLGFINPGLYRDYKPTFLRDINDAGNNSVPFANLNLGTGYSPGYSTGPGWDACTGLGVIDGTAFINAVTPKWPRPWLIDPLAILLGPIYIQIHLPDPPPDSILKERVKNLTNSLSASQKDEILARARIMAVYAKAVESALR